MATKIWLNVRVFKVILASGISIPEVIVLLAIVTAREGKCVTGEFKRVVAKARLINDAVAPESIIACVFSDLSSSTVTSHIIKALPIDGWIL